MKAGAKLRNHTIIILTLMLFVAGVALAGGRAYAFGAADLSGRGISLMGTVAKHGDAAGMDYIKKCNETQPGAFSQEELEYILDQGYLVGYVDELKSLGYISSGYTISSSAVPTQETEETTSIPEPTAYTVEDMEDTPMWATQVVNYRDGASTEYNKIGNLEQYEQITVNGVASTGWYRFNTSDGTTAYVSDSYLTMEDPGNRELNIYNEETEQVDTYIFEDEDPEVIDEAIEDIKEEYEDKEPEAAEPEPEEITEPEPVEEPVTEPAEEGASHPWQFYAFIVFAILCVVVICICIYYMVRNKKRGRVDW